MEEKEQNSLTISDILDQLVKPPIIQSPGVPPPRPISPPSTVLPPIKTGDETEIKLPQLGKIGGEATAPSQNYQTQPAELRLSIRTMADDIERIKRSQKPVAFLGFKKTYPSNIPTPPKPQSPPIISLPPQPRQIPPIPTTSVTPARPPIPQSSPIFAPPPVRPAPLPPISIPLPLAGEIQHFHPEKIVSDALPPFLGAPIPKKIKKPTDEKVEYGLIARIIGSGMTVGILITLILAASAYGLLYFFYLKEIESPIIAPTPTSTEVTTTPVINELETIFSTIATINFQLPNQKEVAVSSFNSFISNQSLLKKEFKKLNITFQSAGQNQKISSFTGLMDNLSLTYPLELKNEINNNAMVLIYGQEELFNAQADSVPKKLVFITEVKDPLKISQIMNAWEQTMSTNMKEIFDIDPSKQASPTFLDNERRGVKIRYKNFPLPDKSLDYSIVTSLSNHFYLIITNSRESMYSPTDKIRGL